MHLFPQELRRFARKRPERTSAPRDSRNGAYGISTADRHHSALMLAARITLRHFSVSSAMSLPKSAGESVSTSPPRSASRALILGSARAALISLLSLSMISAGVFRGDDQTGSLMDGFES